MSRWPSSHFLKDATHLGEPSRVAALAAAHRSQDRGLPAVLTLNHLATHADVEYRYLRQVVERSRNPYRAFTIRKRRGGFRTIVVPDSRLMRVQRWIARFVLNKREPHPASYAYRKNRSIVDCAKNHLGARWLIKVDVRQFFESITEIQAFRVFRDCGYGNLVSFEIARLVTRSLPRASIRRRQKQWTVSAPNRYSISWYRNPALGYVPQGAPTSPMLSNLVMIPFDEEVKRIADSYGLTYTRYSDDMIFSTPSSFSRSDSETLIRDVYQRMGRHGLRPHQSKTVISPPGARKIVLGLLVDGDRVRLRKEFRRMLECHIHFISRHGPTLHAQVRKFETVLGLRRYVEGLLSFAQAVEPDFAHGLRESISTIQWPA